MRRPWLLVVLGASAACTPGGAGAAPAATKTGPPSTPVATVNGVAITEAELAVVLKPSAHGGDAAGRERRQGALDALVREELFRQAAEGAGLQPEPAALEEVARLEALVSVARRRAAADAYVRAVLEKAEPTDAEARAAFEQNAALLRSEYHVQQLFLRDEATIAAAQLKLAAGAAFDEVARGLFPGLPAGVTAPWDLGFLTFKQLPEPWRPVLARLDPGQVSPLIKGPGGRFWLLRLVGKRPSAGSSFEELKPLIVDDLKRARLEPSVAQAEAALRAKAKVRVP